MSKPRIRYDVRISTDDDINTAAYVAERIYQVLRQMVREGSISHYFGDTTLSSVKPAVMTRAERKHDAIIAKHRAANPIP